MTPRKSREQRAADQQAELARLEERVSDLQREPVPGNGPVRYAGQLFGGDAVLLVIQIVLFAVPTAIGIIGGPIGLVVGAVVGLALNLVLWLVLLVLGVRGFASVWRRSGR